MRKWVTIGDYEGDTLVEEHANGDVEGSQRLEKCPTEESANIPPQVSDVVKDSLCEKSEEGSDRVVTERVEQEKYCPTKDESKDCDSEISGSQDNVEKDDKENSKCNEKKILDKVDSERENANQNTISSECQVAKKSSRKWQLAGIQTRKLKESSCNCNGVDGGNKSKKNEENCDEEAMDAELPTPEHITSFYDLVKAVKNSNENLSAQEIENKFKQLSLAFKTDRLTLRQRLDVQQRQRDIAEANFERELDQLRSSILALHEDCIDMELIDAIMQVRKRIDVLTNSSSSLLSASEVWGAVQQEWRVSRALEVLLLHVENVNRLYEHDHQELEEMRRLLTEHQIELPSPPGTTSSNQSSVADAAAASRRIRALSLAGLSKQQSSESGNRRISLGPGASKSVLNNFIATRSSRRRASLMPDLRPFHQELAAVAAAAVAKNKALQDKNEEKTLSNNGMLSSRITEEESESGDDMAENNCTNAGDDSPTATSLRRLAHFPLYGQGLQDPDQRSYEDCNPSHMHGLATDSHLLNNPAANLVPRPQNWMMQGVEELIGLLRERQWPYTSQQTLRGAFTSFLLMLAVFYLILATSSANDELPEPCRPTWPYTVRHYGLPPT